MMKKNDSEISLKSNYERDEQGWSWLNELGLYMACPCQSRNLLSKVHWISKCKEKMSLIAFY